ncbi:MAG: M13 family metallopeptidase [Lachnospiraceae bacterium]|nr:M13 family metallopeptidase [Lachnospiraceae bacterium]
MRRLKIIVTLFLTGCLLVTGCSNAQGTPTSASPAVSADAPEVTGIDSLTPANDYYGYINAADIMEMELKDNQEKISTLGLIAEETDEQVEEIIKEIAESDEDYELGSNEQMIRDLYQLTYQAVEDKSVFEESDTEFTESILEQINSVEDKDDLINMWHDLSNDYSLQTFVCGSVVSNIYDRSEKLIFLSLYPLADFTEIKESDIKAVSYRDSFETYLKLVGVSGSDAENRANDIIYLYYDLAGSSDLSILSGDKEYYEMFEIYTREECEENLKNITYEELLYSIGYDGELPDKIVIPDPGLLWEIDSLVTDEYIQEWKDIALITFLENHSVLLPVEYTQVGIEGYTPDELAVSTVTKYLDTMVSDIYAERYFSDEDREVITKMCDDMVDEYRVLIDDADWLSDEGKAYLTDKLDNMTFFIGCGEKREADPEEGKLFNDTLLQTMYSFSAYEMQKNFDSLFEENVYNGFDDMSPITVNACYVGETNSIVITAAIINDRVFDPDADYAWNLGAIGSIIGHEISHAFDSCGVLYDSHGNYSPNAMSESDIKAFEEMQQMAIEYYDSFTVLGSHVDGKLTLAENFADISGLQCVLAIAGDLESQKIALESYAGVWSALTSDTYAKELLETDPHSPSNIRVNAVVACFDVFYEIYDVKEGDPMYVDPDKRVRRW